MQALQYQNTRPLGMFSYMVMYEMPAIENGDQLAARAEQIIQEKETGAQLRAVSELPELYLARLDVMIGVTAIRVKNGKVGPQLQALLEEACALTHQPPVLTYQDIIMANPVNELRTFLPTNRRPGMEEATFYAKHIQFENSLDYALQVTFQAAESGHVGEDDLNLAITEAKRFNEIMSSFNKLNFQHFPAYRDYYIGHEDYVGPSGYFSARVLAMDLALSGFDILDERHQDAVNQNRDCFPVLEHGLISKGVHIANTNRSLRELAAAECDESIVNLHRGLSEQMDNFRQRHAGVARALIPELETGGHGTADRADVLSTRQELHKKASGCPVRGILRALMRKPVHEQASGFDKEGLRQEMVAAFLDNRGFEIPLTMPVPLPLLVPVAR